jgi:hypothetical protein
VGTRPARAFAASRIPWWAWIVAGDAVLLGLMLFGDLLPWSAVAAHVFPFFALQHEMNLATWWSGAQLFMGALIMYERASTGDARERGAWTVLAVVSAGLSFDEIGSIHERLGHRSWQPLFLVAVPLWWSWPGPFGVWSGYRDAAWPCCSSSWPTVSSRSWRAWSTSSRWFTGSRLGGSGWSWRRAWSWSGSCSSCSPRSGVARSGRPVSGP